MKRIKNKAEQKQFLEERRKFIARAGLLFAGMGLAPSTRFDLVWDLGKKLGFSSSALMANELNAELGKRQFVIYYALRAGTALDSSIAALQSHNNPLRTSGTCNGTVAGALVARHLPTPEEHIALPSDNAGAPAALTYWARALQPILGSSDRKVSMASTFSISNLDGHTANHSIARGGNNGAGPHPALFLASLYGSTALYPGFFWRNNVNVELHRGGPTGNANGTYSGSAVPELSVINGGVNRSMYGPSGAQVSLSGAGVQFANNFAPSPIPLSNAQASLMVQTTKKFNQNYVANLTDGDALVQAAETGGNNMTIDLRNELLPTAAAVQAVMPDAFQRFRFNQVQPGSGINYQLDSGEATFMTAMSFALGGTKAAVIGASTDDWHGFWNGANAALTASREQRATIRPSMYGTHFAEIIAATYDLMKHFPNPVATDGSTVADALTFVFQSEFGRSSIVNGGTPNSMAQNCGGNDNNDGGRAFTLAIGPNLKQGSYGDVNITTGAMQPFDVQTGATVGGSLNTGVDAYKTICAAIGIPAANVNQYVTAGAAWPSWLKS